MPGIHSPGGGTGGVAAPAHLSSMLAPTHRYHYVLFQEDGKVRLRTVHLSRFDIVLDRCVETIALVGIGDMSVLARPGRSGRASCEGVRPQQLRNFPTIF